MRPGPERTEGAEMPWAPVEIDDEDGSAKGRGAAQQPDPSVVAEVIEDQVPAPLFAIFRHHGGAVCAITPEAGWPIALRQSGSALGGLRPSAHTCPPLPAPTTH